YEVYDLAKVNLLGAVQDAGYAHAKLDAKVRADLPTHTAFVELAFTPGPKCKFGNIDVHGVDGDLRDAILHRLDFAPGDTYSNRAVTKTQREIYGMGRFSTVQVQPEDGDGEVVNMKVAVSESAAHQVTLGGGFGIDPISYEVRGRAGYEVTGWPMPLDTVTVDLRPAYAYLRDGSGYEPRMRAVTRLERQDLFATYAVGSVEVGYNYLAYEAFTEYGPEAQLGYELRLHWPRLKLRVGYLIHYYDFRDPSELVDPALQMMIGIDHPELVGAYQQSIIADFRDHPVEPRLGIYGEIKVTEGTKYAGGDYTYQQVVPELRGYVPIGPVVIAARARYGAIYGEVPPTERFYAGGSTSQRGFAERELSPSVTGTLMNGSTITVPYGGAGLIDTSIEARFPLARIKKMPLGAVVFLDGGDVTERPAELDIANLNWAAGLGLRLLTVVGPVRADFGYRLNRTGPDDPQPGSSYAFHLSLGEAF
ncbi:MAG TPA: BamA/TamA family outer membrane protein, partial [Kofleriaceae bacterium]|nr:BamA/TamA family outer membrane protein [Kofleriaceae bacterium]